MSEQNTNPIALQLILYRLEYDADTTSDYGRGVLFVIDRIASSLELPENWRKDICAQLESVQAQLDQQSQ